MSPLPRPAIRQLLEDNPETVSHEEDNQGRESDEPNSSSSADESDQDRRDIFLLGQPPGKLKKNTYVVVFSNHTRKWETAQLFSSENPRFKRYYNLRYLQSS